MQTLLCTGSVPPAELREQFLEKAEAVRGAALQAAVAREVSSDISVSDISFGAMSMRVPHNNTSPVRGAALQAAVAREVSSDVPASDISLEQCACEYPVTTQSLGLPCKLQWHVR